MSRRRTARDWRRRIRRTPAGPVRCALRIARALTVLLAVTGCAIEAPRPDLLPPPSETPITLVPPPVLSRFGEWRGEGGTAGPARHAGIDIRAASGTPVLAAADGVVLRTGFQRYAGRLVVVAHDVALATVYYHLSAFEVTPGQPVRRGDVVGRAGASGNATAPHLHFGVCRREGGRCGERIDGGWDDPTRYWIAVNPCFVSAPAPAPAPEDRRLTYPLPCAAAGAPDRTPAQATRPGLPVRS